MKKTLILASLILSTAAFADYSLSKSKDVVQCTADDSVIITLNAKRTTLKYMVEGESLGPQKIISKKDNGRNSVTYTTKIHSLTLSDRGDTFIYDGDQEAGTVDCE